MRTSQLPIRHFGTKERHCVQKQGFWRTLCCIVKKPPPPPKKDKKEEAPKRWESSEPVVAPALPQSGLSLEGAPGRPGVSRSQEQGEAEPDRALSWPWSEPGAWAILLWRDFKAVPTQRGQCFWYFQCCLWSLFQECGQKARTGRTSMPSVGPTRKKSCRRAMTSAKYTSSLTLVRSSG